MPTVPAIYVDGVLTVVVKNRQYQITKEDFYFNTIKQVLKTATEDELYEILNGGNVSFLGQIIGAEVTFDGNDVYVNGSKLNNHITDMISQWHKEGLPYDNLLNFIKKVFENPSKESREELFDFLKHKNLPITDSGNFLAYKAVRSDFKDKYSGTIDNSVGRTIKMKRLEVDDDRRRECSYGLHVGHMDYVKSYMNANNGDIVIIVEVNPRDAVAVPKDYDCMKLRVCEYTVVGIYEGLLEGTLYKKVDPVVNGSGVKENSIPFEPVQGAWGDSDESDNDEWFGGVRDSNDYNKVDVEVDDSFLAGEVTSQPSNTPEYGVKPTGQRYYNVRDSKGHFVRKYS